MHTHALRAPVALVLPVGFKLAFRIMLGLLVLLISDRLATWSSGAATAGHESDAELHSSPTDQSDSNSEFRDADDAGRSAASVPRLREGAKLVNEPGNFKMSGDRAIFVTRDNQQFSGLENLNLARVVNTIRDDPDGQWSVSGLVTEYRGSNYLLITRAVRKTSAAETPREGGASEK